MQVWTRTFMIAGAVLALGATLPVEADEQKPYRVAARSNPWKAIS
jgi:hypothetical protein